MSTPMTTGALLEALRRHYIEPGADTPGGTFVSEVGVNGRFGASSRCDALYAGFTSASGRILIGHELKVSRADWRHELEQLDKADWWADNCHAWYVVAPSTDIVPPEELPAGWGLMVPNPRAKRRMTIAVKATVHAERTPSWDAMRSVLARIDTLRGKEIRDTVNRQVMSRVEEARKRERERVARPELSYDDEATLRAARRLEEQFGIKLGWGRDGVSVEEFHRALQIARDLAKLPGGGNSPYTNLWRAQEEAERAVDTLARLRELVDPLADAANLQREPAPAVIA